MVLLTEKLREGDEKAFETTRDGLKRESVGVHRGGEEKKGLEGLTLRFGTEKGMNKHQRPIARPAAEGGRSGWKTSMYGKQNGGLDGTRRKVIAYRRRALGGGI